MTAVLCAGLALAGTLAAAELGREELRNGGFEDPFPKTLPDGKELVELYKTYGWWHLRPEMLDGTVRHAGKTSVRLLRMPDVNRFNSYGQLWDLVVMPDAAYRLGFWYRTDTTERFRLSMACHWRTPKLQRADHPSVVFDETVIPDDGWWRFCERIVLTPPASLCPSFAMFASFHIDSVDPGRGVWIDDVSLRRVLLDLDRVSWSDGTNAFLFDLPRAVFGSNERIEAPLTVEAASGLKGVSGRVTIADVQGATLKEVSVPEFDVRGGALGLATITFETEGLADGEYTLTVALADARKTLVGRCARMVRIESKRNAEAGTAATALAEAAERLDRRAREADRERFVELVRVRKARWLLEEARERYFEGRFAASRAKAAAALEELK